MTHLVSDRQGLEFQIQMIEDAFDVHEYDEETGERCCTADAPCTTRQGITKVHADASAKLAALVGEGRKIAVADDEPTRKSSGGDKASTGKPVSNPASEKQVAYIAKLAAQHDVSKIGTFPARTLAQIEKGEDVSKTRASSLIDALRRQPLAANAPAAPRATEKQLGYLRSLMTQKGYTVNEDSLAKLGPKDASEMIDLLQKRPDAPKPEAVPAPELEDGMYKLGDTIYKVQHAVNGSGRQYAKQLEGDAENGFGFEFAAGAIRKLRPEHRMTMEEAQEFGALYGTCCVCGRTLTDEKSIERGIGPVCAGRI